MASNPENLRPVYRISSGFFCDLQPLKNPRWRFIWHRFAKSCSGLSNIACWSRALEKSLARLCPKRHAQISGCSEFVGILSVAVAVFAVAIATPIIANCHNTPLVAQQHLCACHSWGKQRAFMLYAYS